MAKQINKNVPPTRRRKTGRGGGYWALFALCSGLSFAAGFWYTYQMTSQVAVKDPGANEITLATPLPNQALVTPGPDALEASEGESFVQPTSTTGLDETPAPASTPPARATATPAPSRAVVTPAPEGPGEGVYRVQVGSYSSREEAQAMVEELAVAGIDAMVVEDEGKYHAQIGAYASRDRALGVADDVNTKGYSVTIRH